MRYTLLILFVFPMQDIFAQFEIPERADIEKFYKTKTMIVLEDNPMSEYNVLIKEIIPEIWKITPYGFCTRADFEELPSKSGVSVLSVEEFFFETDKTGVKYNFLCLSLGDKFNKNKTYFDLFHFPLSYFADEEEEYMHKIPVVIRVMQEFINYLRNNPGVTKADVRKAFFSESSQLSGKTLYLAKEDAEKSLQDENKFGEIYPYSFKFVSYDDLQEQMINPGTNSVVLFKVGIGKGNKKARCYKAIIGADDGHIYYFDYHLINENKPDGLLLDDLKKIAKP